MQAAPLLDNIVFKSVKQGFGGKLRFVVSGGAPLARRVQDYLQIALCCPVLQGYGLTETCAPQNSFIPCLPLLSIVTYPQLRH